MVGSSATFCVAIFVPPAYLT